MRKPRCEKLKIRGIKNYMRSIPTGNLFINVLVRDRSGILFEGDVEALTSFNDKGEFDVLPLHGNFISIINRSVILRMGGEVSRNIPLETGVLKVYKDKVEVYLGIAH